MKGSVRRPARRKAGAKYGGKPLRPRDFIEDRDGWIYAVSAYDSDERAGCVLRYVPDPAGERVSPEGVRYRKLDFEESFRLISDEKPEYLGEILRIPLGDIACAFKPEERLAFCAGRDGRVGELAGLFSLPAGDLGCTGSRLCGIESAGSDIDLVVYGRSFFDARETLRRAIGGGLVDDLSPDMWRTVYAKREPEIPFEVFLVHERRKWNRGEIRGTYFDLLFTRSYDDLAASPAPRGKRVGKRTIEATVKDASLSFDNPATYEVEHDEVARVVCFTHTYSGQALDGEVIEACGVLEEQGDELVLVVGTTRTARGEYIISRTLLDGRA
ncbi:MAG TPA: DNA polymerase subunit beta [Methanomicrobiales archaeon]|nr:DNA polymerase subunit beta [Methanomicrobiales archaeon]